VARRWVALAGAAGLSTALSHTGIAPVQMGAGTGLAGHIASGALSGLSLACPWPVPGLSLAWPMAVVVHGAPRGAMTRHEREAALIRFLTGFGFLFFTAIVAIPFSVMVMASLKTQGAWLANPLDCSIGLGHMSHPGRLRPLHPAGAVRARAEGGRCADRGGQPVPRGRVRVEFGRRVRAPLQTYADFS